MKKPSRKDLRRLKVIERKLTEVVSCFDGLTPETKKYFNEEFEMPAVIHLRQFNSNINEAVRVLKNQIEL